MITIGFILLIAGIGLSAFFSGCETGFYRASRLRIVMDAMQGDKVSRRILFLTNRPHLFVATALVGNNTANYIASLAIVLLSNSIFGSGLLMELLASVFFSPLVFVYGELMPKNLFYQAPNYLLRLTSRLFLFFAVVFAPISALLWLLGKILEHLFGQSPQKIRLTLARKDLGDFFVEGQHAGILHPTQLQLAQNFFLVATIPVSRSMTPLSKIRVVDQSETRMAARQKSQRMKMTELVVVDGRSGELTGYLRTIELFLNDEPGGLSRFVNPLVDISQNELHGEAIMKLQASGELMGRVVDDQGNTQGVVTLDALIRPLLEDPLLALQGQSVRKNFPFDIQAT